MNLHKCKIHNAIIWLILFTYPISGIEIEWIGSIDKNTTIHDLEFSPTTVHLSDNIIYIGEKDDDEGAIDAGAIHCFSRSGNDISGVSKLIGSSFDESVGLVIYEKDNVLYSYSKSEGAIWYDTETSNGGSLDVNFVNHFSEIEGQLLVSNSAWEYDTSLYDMGVVRIYDLATKALLGSIQSPDYLNPSSTTTVGNVIIADYSNYLFGTDVVSVNDHLAVSSPGSPLQLGDQNFDAGAVYIYNRNDLYGNSVQKIQYSLTDLNDVGVLGRDIEVSGSNLFILSELTGSSILIYEYSLNETSGQYERLSTLDVLELIEEYSTDQIISMQNHGFKIYQDNVILTSGSFIYVFSKVAGAWTLQNFTQIGYDGFSSKLEVDQEGYFYIPRDKAVAVFKVQGQPGSVNLTPLVGTAGQQNQTDSSSSSSGGGGGGCLLKTISS